MIVFTNRRLSMRACLIGLLLSLHPTGFLVAQAVRGQVSADGTGAAVAGAVVQLLDARQDVVTGVLSGPDGAYLLRAPQPGSYRVRVERIGFAGLTSEALELAASSEVVLPLVVSAEAVLLAGITAQGRSRGCSLRDGGETVERVWNEARKALNAIEISQSQRLIFFDSETFHRELDPRTRQLRHEQRRSTYGTAGNPFQSIPVEQLHSDGYVRAFADSSVYFGPDATVLLSDEFLDGHCFRIRESADEPTLVGLAFTPVRGASRADIEGVLWLDRNTAELRSVDYRYVRPGLDVTGDVPGGRIEFERISTGAWIVRRWVIRMPILELHRNRWTDPSTGMVQDRSETVVTGIVEEGGEVVAIHDRPVATGGLAMHTVAGVLRDSLENRPLAGVLVYLSGTSYADTTDRAGRFEIQRVTAGQYVASFIHPLLTTLGVSPPQQRIVLEGGRDLEIDLAVPSEPGILASYCPGADAASEGMVAGFVRNTSGGAPIAGARLRARWTSESSLRGESLRPRTTPSGDRVATAEGARFDVTVQEMEVVADRRGFYRLCGTARRGEARIEVSAPGQGIQPQTVRVRLGPLVAQDLRVEVR